MTWPQWIAQVLSIAAQRGLIATVEYPAPGYALFHWRGSYRVGDANAGITMYEITSPESFTFLWHDGPPILRDPDEVKTERPEYRRKRYVPRIPARAVAMALQELFS